MLTKVQLLEAIKDAPDDAVIMICEAKPSPDCDNVGLEVQGAAWDHNTPLEPGEKGIIYIMADGVEQHDTNPSPICTEHLAVYFDPERGDKPFCVDEEGADDPDGMKNPGGTGWRYGTPAELARFVEGWLEEAKAEHD